MLFPKPTVEEHLCNCVERGAECAENYIILQGVQSRDKHCLFYIDYRVQNRVDINIVNVLHRKQSRDKHCLCSTESTE